MIKVGIWGCGGISASHRKAYDILEKSGVPVKLVALCDINSGNFNKTIRINISGSEEPQLPEIENCYLDIDDMLEKENLDLVDICLPTFLHKDSCIKILEKGINVIVEKPMSLSEDDCDKILMAAADSKGRFMVAHCVRFDSHYSYLKEAVASGEYGRLISADFSRLSSLPLWKVGKASQDENVIFDMHIHDIDFVQGLFGTPDALSAVYNNNRSYCDVVSTVFKYGNAFINIKADWSFPQSFGFSTPYKVVFENAMIEYDGKGNEIIIHEDSGKRIITADETDAYTNEINYFIDLIIKNKTNTLNPPGSSKQTIRLLEKISFSAENDGIYVTL